MIGKSHVAVAAGGWAAGTLAVAALLGVELGPVDTLAAVVVAGGAGISPDMDHPDASIARTHGVVSHCASRIIHRISGGHRGGTHWLSTGAAVGAAVAAANAVWPRWAMAVALATCGAWFLRCAMPRRFDRIWAPVAAGVAAWAAYRGAGAAAWLALAVAWGWAVHLFCDAVTSERDEGESWLKAPGRRGGVPMFAPFTYRRVAFGWLEGVRTDPETGRVTGGRGERRVAVAFAWLAILATAWALTPPGARTLGVDLAGQAADVAVGAVAR